MHISPVQDQYSLSYVIRNAVVYSALEVFQNHYLFSQILVNILVSKVVSLAINNNNLHILRRETFFLSIIFLFAVDVFS